MNDLPQLPCRPLSLSAMARRLGVTVRWLRSEADAGRVPHLKAECRYLFDSPTVERLMRERAAKGGDNAR